MQREGRWTRWVGTARCPGESSTWRLLKRLTCQILKMALATARKQNAVREILRGEEICQGQVEVGTLCRPSEIRLAERKACALLRSRADAGWSKLRPYKDRTVARRWRSRCGRRGR